MLLAFGVERSFIQKHLLHITKVLIHKKAMV